jgi:hypothetical protein
MVKAEMKKLFLFIPFLLLFLTSCEKKLIPKVKTNNKEIFQDLWSYVDKGYPFFLERDIAWDSVYKICNPQIYDTLTERQMFDICARMLDTLQDGSVKLYSGFSEYFYNYYIKAPANFNEGLLERNYWQGYQKAGPLLFKVIDTVGYIYYGSFKDRISDAQMDIVVNKFVNDSVKGVILDIRNNLGGDPENLLTIYKRIDIPDTFHKIETLLYETVYKNGPKHDKFTNVSDTWVTENIEGRFPAGKFILLTNRKCYGMATLAASGCQAYPNGKVMGDTTGGGSGYPLLYELANGWRVEIPGSKSLTGAGQFLHDGIAPDTVIYMAPADEAAGHDTILDAAIAEAKKQR